MDRDNAAGYIWEWFNEPVDKNTFMLLEKISNAKVVKVRWHGSQYYDDKTMSPQYIKSIKNTLEYYKAMGGKIIE